MPNIKPVSDLRNYNEVLKDISIGSPVFLTKNGRGKFVIVNIEEYEKTQETIKSLSELLGKAISIHKVDELAT
jgi:prevent-host-death family protein